MRAIHAVSLSKTYTGLFRRSGQVALAGVDLTVQQGTAFGLIGANGAGKTTFIKALLGVVQPTGGTVEVLGGRPEDVAVRRRIGYLPERLHLPSSSTPVEFLRSVGRLKRLKLSSVQLDDSLGRVGLDSASRRRIGGFSKGMRQRLGLAAALLGSPSLLVLDEPTDGVDPVGRVEIRNLLSEELKRGATLFLNSHLLSETERLCARIGILSHGRVVKEGSLAELKQSTQVWKVQLTGALNAEALSTLGFLPTGVEGRYTLPSPDAEALNTALEGARRSGALLTELVRSEKDLEAVLTEALEDGAR